VFRTRPCVTSPAHNVRAVSRFYHELSVMKLNGRTELRAARPAGLQRGSATVAS